MKSDKKTMYVCSACGKEYQKWMGQCTFCGAWNTLEETVVSTAKTAAKSVGVKTVTAIKPTAINKIEDESEVRFSTGMKELDRVLGGGIVKGSLILLSGEPGAGKSTLLIQICEFLAKKLSVLYVSGEESAKQIKLRASRLGVFDPNIQVVSETDMESICGYIETEKPGLVVIDSIQTMSLDGLTSSPGSITQVRECTNMLLQTGKSLDIPILVVGHVNKDGNIAGPKVLEHIVDAVLYFEGDKQFSYRILRSAKNRYGSTNEIGVFDMTGEGLQEIPNPSMMFLDGRPEQVSGTCVTCNIEGSRPILSEIQALVTKSNFAAPRRVSTGVDYNRANLLIAVMEKRGGYFFGNLDVYINVVGGIRLDDTGADLAVITAMYSSIKDTPIPDKTAVVGEVGLTGEVRAVSQLAARVAECKRLGFDKCVVPAQNLRHNQVNIDGIEVIGVKNIGETFKAVFGK